MPGGHSSFSCFRRMWRPSLAHLQGERKMSTSCIITLLYPRGAASHGVEYLVVIRLPEHNFHCCREPGFSLQRFVVADLVVHGCLQREVVGATALVRHKQLLSPLCSVQFAHV